MLKKLGGAIIVAAVAFAGMAASAAVAVQMLRPEAKRPAAPEVAAAGATVAPKAQPAKKSAKKRAKAPKAPHPWNAPCAAAKSEAELLIATAELDQREDILRLAREGMTINVRLYQTLRRTPGGGRVGRAFLSRLERGIAADRNGLAQLARSITEAELQRWAARSQKDNAALAAYAKRMGAPTCADYFTV